MKNVLLPIVTAALLICGPAAAGKKHPDPCAPYNHAAAQDAVASARHHGPGAVRSRRGCARIVNAQFNRRVLSAREIERMLKRRYPGEMNEMFCNKPWKAQPNSCVEQRVQWKITRPGGKSDFCTLIVDAKTGTVLKELGKKCPRA